MPVPARRPATAGSTVRIILEFAHMSDWLDEVSRNAEGLVPVIAQDVHDGVILMQAWMNREALALTLQEGRAVYWSRSRARLWRKGESSGNEQVVCSVRLDCDGDTVLLEVKQKGGIACHTGRRRCFYRRWVSDDWVETEAVLKDPAELYGR